MKKREQSNDQLIRSGARIRESVRCLPRGHFEQIRQMFDNSTRKSEHRTNIDDLIHETEQNSSSNGKQCCCCCFLQ